MDDRLNSIITSIRDSLEKTKTALQKQYVNVESLKVSEIPDYIRQIERNKYTLTINCSEFESGTITATQESRTRTGTVENGTCNIKIPVTGNWHIEHESGDYIDIEVSGSQSVELVKKKVTFSEGDCSEEKLVIHVDSVVGNNKNDNFIQVKKNGIVIQVQAQLVGSDIEITNFEYEDGATYTIEYILNGEVRGSIEVVLSSIPSNLAGSADSFWEGVEGVTYQNFLGGIYSGQPAHIVFTDQKAPQDAKISYWTENGKNGIARWRDNNTDTLYISTQKTGKKVILPESCYYLFNGKQFTEFNANTKTLTIDLTNVDTSNVTSMEGMFGGIKNLNEIKNLNLFNTNNVTSFAKMFNGCENIVNLDLSNFNTDKVNSLYAMFSGCSKLEKVDLSNFNVMNVEDVEGMFDICEALTTIYAQEWASKKPEINSNMFNSCDSLPGYSYDKRDFSMAKWKENGGYFTNPAEKPS